MVTPNDQPLMSYSKWLARKNVEFRIYIRSKDMKACKEMLDDLKNKFEELRQSLGV